MDHDRPRSLLAATDLSAPCDHVLRAAGALAAHVGAELHVLHVVEGAGGEEEDDAAGGPFEAAREELARQLARCLPPGAAAASGEVRGGAVHEAVAARVDEVAADLLVVGPGGESAAGAHFLGSTADRLLRTTRIPCLVVRGRFEPPLGGIGVPTDFSDPARQALHLAFRWAAALTGGASEGAPVRLAHVDSPVTQIDVPDHEETTLRPRLAAEIEAAAAATGAVVAAEADVLWDNLASQRLCRWAEQRALALLVVGTHGRSGLPRFLLGSLATRLAREAPCSVLLVPPAEEPAE